MGVVKQVGLIPGTAVFAGEKKTDRLYVELLEYGAKFSEFSGDLEAEYIKNARRHRGGIFWLNCVGLHEADKIETIGRHFKLHPLVIEDILHTGQRPKLEIGKDYLYVVIKMLSFNLAERQVETEQLSLVFGKNYVITFQERPGDVFDPIRDRIQAGKGMVRDKGADYLAYLLLDIIVDNYFFIIENISDIIDELEGRLLSDASQDILKEIYRLKNEILLLRKAVWPLLDMMIKLQHTGSRLIKPENQVYLKDLHDHTVQVFDTIDTHRDMAASMLDLYLSNVSRKTNDVMKFLAVISTIFIPLTFIAGVYGMNFRFMPELESRNGYYIVLGAMGAIGIGLFLWFKRKKWV